tara:strand:+ start:2761 stop:2898 length:138 start_codon:yes stop_codon:yes gene_type:complete
MKKKLKNKKKQKLQNGKGDTPRSCFSKKYRSNYDDIEWGKKKKKP